MEFVCGAKVVEFRVFSIQFSMQRLFSEAAEIVMSPKGGDSRGNATGEQGTEQRE